MSQSMAWEDASEAKISNNFSTIQLIKTHFIENVCMPCRQKTRKTEAKLSNFFSAIKLTESSTLPPGRELIRQLSMQRFSTIESPTITACSCR